MTPEQIVAKAVEDFQKAWMKEYGSNKYRLFYTAGFSQEKIAEIEFTWTHEQVNQLAGAELLKAWKEQTTRLLSHSKKN